jgi:hypothetical protein
MYGLPQAGILAKELLQRNLAKDRYRPTTHTGNQIEAKSRAGGFFYMGSNTKTDKSQTARF